MKRIIEWLLEAKVLMADAASTASFAMLLVWALGKEYRRLFRHRPVLRARNDAESARKNGPGNERANY